MGTKRRHSGGRWIWCDAFPAGDRVVAFHHIPAEMLLLHPQTLRPVAVYKKVGITAGFEPAGGGFAQYVRVMDWIVDRGVEKIPEGCRLSARPWWNR